MAIFKDKFPRFRCTNPSDQNGWSFSTYLIVMNIYSAFIKLMTPLKHVRLARNTFAIDNFDLWKNFKWCFYSRSQGKPDDSMPFALRGISHRYIFYTNGHYKGSFYITDNRWCSLCSRKTSVLQTSKKNSSRLERATKLLLLEKFYFFIIYLIFI